MSNEQMIIRGEVAEQTPSPRWLSLYDFQLRDETRQADNGCLTGTNILSKLLWQS